MNDDDMYRTVTGYPKKDATCLTDHNSISAQSTKIAQRQFVSKVGQEEYGKSGSKVLMV